MTVFRLSNQRLRYLKVTVFLALLIPLALLVIGAVQNTLGPDPAKVLADQTGEWALRILLLTLLISPLTHFAFPQALRFRRMLGLFAFFYASLHLLVFLTFFVSWDFGLIAEELVERPYITAGFLGWLILLPLAITSTQRWRRNLGHRWLALHKGVYLAAALGLLHLWWQVRSSWLEAAVYVALFALLMLSRVLIAKRQRSS